jgi:hypothetical protein
MFARSWTSRSRKLVSLSATEDPYSSNRRSGTRLRRTLRHDAMQPPLPLSPNPGRSQCPLG